MMSELPPEAPRPRKRAPRKTQDDEVPLRKRVSRTVEGEAEPRKRAPRKRKSTTVEFFEGPTETVELEPVALEGELPPRSRGRRVARLALKYGALASLVFVIASGCWILLYRFVNPPVTPLMVLRHFQEEEDLRKRWRGLEAISPDLVLAVVAAEDQRFFEHRGFDFEQIQAAIDEKLRGGRLRGGSTISQQVAKNVFLWPGRSWIRKGLEAWFTAGIELCWGKERILEVYLNVAEMGKGIYGAEAAAQAYYQKSALELSLNESAILATVLPDPRDRSPLSPTSAMRERQDWILRQMRNLGSLEALKGVDS